MLRAKKWNQLKTTSILLKGMEVCDFKKSKQCLDF